MKRNILTLLIAVSLLIQVPLVSAQSDTRRGGWAARALTARQQSAAPENPAFQNEVAAVALIEPQAATDKKKIVGTWIVTVPGTPEAPGFNALQTFHEDGTFTETSDLLASLTEGPAHGVWSGKKNNFLLTFELFVFDNQQPVGRVRVRCAITLMGDDNLAAATVVDFIEPNGNVIPNIGSGPFTATRLKVLSPQ